jgi:hypothetical protein
MDPRFKPGALVRHKAGDGTRMAIDVINDNFGTTLIWCSWMVKGKKMQDHFSPDALELYETPQPIQTSRAVFSRD